MDTMGGVANERADLDKALRDRVITCRIGLWRSAVQAPREAEAWLTFVSGGDADDYAWLCGGIREYERQRYVGAITCRCEADGSGWINSVCGDTPEDVLRDAMTTAVEFAARSRYGMGSVLGISFEPWCHDLPEMEGSVQELIDNIEVQQALHSRVQ
ncbi:MAG TPA: hypothetical protein VFQ88_07325 [Nevskiaceae bacterium]|nr:hypothetical protein [Nevskiaceae bacterium]